MRTKLAAKPRREKTSVSHQDARARASVFLSQGFSGSAPGSSAVLLIRRRKSCFEKSLERLPTAVPGGELSFELGYESLRGVNGSPDFSLIDIVEAPMVVVVPAVPGRNDVRRWCAPAERGRTSGGGDAKDSRLRGADVDWGALRLATERRETLLRPLNVTSWRSRS